MSTLEDIFDDKHTLACTRAPVKHVMLVEKTDDRPAGYYFVSVEEIEAAAVSKTIAFSNLGRRVGLKDLLAWSNLDWYPAVDHCWCDRCQSGRQFRSTLSD